MHSSASTHFLQGLSKCTKLVTLDVSANRLRIFPAEVRKYFIMIQATILAVMLNSVIVFCGLYYNRMIIR